MGREREREGGRERRRGEKEREGGRERKRERRRKEREGAGGRRSREKFEPDLHKSEPHSSIPVTF